MKYYMELNILKKYLIFLTILLLSFSCRENDSKLPYAYINYSFYLTDPAFFNLNSIGGTAYIPNEGINGVILYRRSVEEIVAFDGNCTYEPDKRCAVQFIENKSTAIDSCCGSEFQLIDGYPISGPASLALYEYRVLIDNNRVVILNQ